MSDNCRKGTRFRVQKKHSFLPALLLAASHVAPSHEAILAAEDARNGLRIGDVLLLQDARRESLCRVLVEHRHARCMMIAPWFHASSTKCTVHPATLAPYSSAWACASSTGKRGQKRGMDVQDAVGEGAHKLRREDAHVSGEADQVDAMLLSAAMTSASCSARFARGWNGDGGPAPTGARPRGPAASARFDRTTAISAPGRRPRNRLGDGDKVRTASREQNPKSLQAVPPPSTCLASGARPPLHRTAFGVAD